jgi:hypothetical protein
VELKERIPDDQGIRPEGTRLPEYMKMLTNH